MDTKLKKGQLLSEEECQKALEEYGPHFKTDLGGSAIKDLIKSVDLEFMSKKLRKSLEGGGKSPEDKKKALRGADQKNQKKNQSD